MSLKNKKTIYASTSSESNDIHTISNSSEEESSVEDTIIINPVAIKTGSDIREMNIKDINSEYGVATYFDFEVIVMKSNGYINCTEMCEYFSRITDSGKKFKYWSYSITSKSLIAELASELKTSASNLMIDIKNQITPGINGTYCAQELIPAIICWAHPPYFITVSNIVNKHFLEKIKITSVDNNNKKLLSHIEELLDKADKIIDQNDTILSNTKYIRQGKKTNEDDKNKFAFYVIENNDKVKKGVTVYNYGTVRANICECEFDSVMEKYKIKHPNMKIISKIISNEKSANLWSGMREYLRNKNKITGISSQFNLCDTVTIKNIIAVMENYHDDNVAMK